MYAVSGVMQGMLLIVCIAWKIRQRRLNIDDFGHPLYADGTAAPGTVTAVPVGEAEIVEEEDEEEPVPDVEIVRAMLGEDTPLLKNGRRRKSKSSSRQASGSGLGWLNSLRR